MKDEDFLKFDKETWFRFMRHTGQLDQSLFNVLTAFERNVQIDRILARSKDIREKMEAIQDDDEKLSEYIKLLGKSLRNHKRLDKFYED